MAKAQRTAPPLIDIKVELFGIARLATGRRLVELAVPDDADPGDLVAALAQSCPELLGKVVREDGSSLLESYTFNLNGTRFVSDQRLQLKPGDTVLLFSSQAGG